jgi:glycosyltransferase involved in cell wall biosynthesis
MSLPGPSFSVVIATHNYAHFLEKALTSVMMQDYPEDLRETIVVDDGSTDDTEAVLARFRGKIHAIKQPNQGQAAAINLALQQATGELIAFLDPDDTWYPNKLTAVAAQFEDDQVGMVQHQMDVEERGVLTRRKLQTVLSHGWLKTSALTYEYRYMPTSALCFRRSVLNGALPAPEMFRTGGTDSYFAVMAALESKIAALDEPLGVYRIHGENAFKGNITVESLEAQLRVVEEVLGRAASRAKDLKIELPENFERFRFAEYPTLRRMDLAKQASSRGVPGIYWNYLRKYAWNEYNFSWRFLKRAVHMAAYGFLPSGVYKKLHFLRTTHD